MIDQSIAHPPQFLFIFIITYASVIQSLPMVLYQEYFYFDCLEYCCLDSLMVIPISDSGTPQSFKPDVHPLEGVSRYPKLD